MGATDGWRHGYLATTNRNRSKRPSASSRPEGSWKPRRTGSWFALRNARTIRSSAPRPWIRTVHQSHGWVDCRWLSSIPEPSDKRTFVTEFSATDFGDRGGPALGQPARE